MKTLSAYITEKLKITKNNVVDNDNSFESLLYKLSEVLFDNKFDISKDLRGFIDEIFSKEYIIELQNEENEDYQDLKYPNTDFADVDEILDFFEELINLEATYKIVQDTTSKFNKQRINIYIDNSIVFSLKCDFKSYTNNII